MAHGLYILVFTWGYAEKIEMRVLEDNVILLIMSLVSVRLSVEDGVVTVSLTVRAPIRRPRRVDLYDASTESPPSSGMDPSLITTFFQSSTRETNDATNAIRERILGSLSTLHAFLEDPLYGAQWRLLIVAWDTAVRTIAEQTHVPPYDRVSVSMKGGRGYHYDADLLFHIAEGAMVRRIEFKYGASRVAALPQFLSLQAKFPMFPVTYDAFYYDHFLERYRACDEGLTEPMLAREEYLRRVTSTTYEFPFFHQLKEREHVRKLEKNRVVNDSITAYLEAHGPSMNLACFAEKLQVSQAGKIYLLWSDGAFHVDTTQCPSGSDSKSGSDSDGIQEPLVYLGIKGGNTIRVQQGGTEYHLLLRWRNHKGILNPAWQIKKVQKN